MALLLPSAEKLGFIKHFIFAKQLPIAWAKFIFWMSLPLILGVSFFTDDIYADFKYISEHIYDPEQYIKIGLILFIYRLIVSIESYFVYDWAELYGLKITSIKAIDLFERQYSFLRLISREYSVKVENESGEEGEVLFLYVYQQIVNPDIEWISKPLVSQKLNKIIPNNLHK